ncbi:MAG: hypothetical protein WD749_13215 [Phycisphaerales bacterium]
MQRDNVKLLVAVILLIAAAILFAWYFGVFSGTEVPPTATENGVPRGGPRTPEGGLPTPSSGLVIFRPVA